MKQYQRHIPKATVVAEAVSSIKFAEFVPKYTLARVLNVMLKDQSIWLRNT